jgi:hypothetical protein
MELLKSVLILIIIGLLWLLLVFFSFKKVAKTQAKGDQWMLFFGLFLFFLIGAIFVIGAGVVEFVDSPGFCGNFCHPMEEYYDSYEHPGNNTMMATHEEHEVTCSNCHDKPGIGGKVYALSYTGQKEMVIYVSGAYDEDDLGGHVTSTQCTKCHDGSVSMVPKNMTTAIDTDANPHERMKGCVNCHDPHGPGTGLTENSCSVCHGTQMAEFETKLEKHGNRTDKDCMECHDRVHPENAEIPFDSDLELFNDEFCSDCHDTEYEAYGLTFNNQSVLFYGGCTDCHEDHDSFIIPHDDSAEYELCGDCHSNYDEDGSIHYLSTLPFETDLDIEFCSDCHNDIYQVFKNTSTDTSLERYGDCINCHTDHKSIQAPHAIASPYDDCIDCHSNYNEDTTIHDVGGISFMNVTDIEDEFCESCHAGKTTGVDAGDHDRRDCIDCHEDHTIGMDFQNCADCHDNIPSSHDEDRTDCADCHDMTKVH